MIPNLAAANIYSAVNYKITRILNQDAPSIRVDVEITGKLANKVVINLPYAWASANYSKQITNINLIAPQGRLELNTQNDNQAIITLPLKADTLHLSYDITQKLGDSLDVHEAIIHPNLIHLPGHGLFAIPDDLTDTLKFNVTWQNIPAEWQILSDYGAGQTLNLNTSSDKLLHAMYIAGNLRVYQIATEASPVFLSIYGEFNYDDATIIKQLGEIIATQRGFFQDYNFPYYLISLIEGKDPNSFGGTMMSNSFAAFFPKDIDSKDYYILFAHEHLHNWIGGKIRKDQQGELNYWWSEGFTDYFSRVLALRSGGLSLKDFIDECDLFFRQYYLSPVINEPNSRIQQDFWKNYDVEKLPYYRGFMFALYLNNLIKQNNPNYSVDNVMLDLFKGAQEHEFSSAHFKDVVKAYVPKGIEHEMHRFIDNGETISLDNLSAVLPIEQTQIGNYELGFDQNIFLQERIIKNIDEQSNAYKAGLRNGDKIIGWSYYGLTNPDQTISLQTIDKTFEFRPESSNKTSVYKFKKSLSYDDQVKIKRFFGVNR
jgi:hypothetical protein